MRTKKNEAQIHRLAVDWVTSGLSQEVFAKKNGISSRALRGYVRRYCRPASSDDVLTAVDRALRELTELRARLVALPVASSEREPAVPITPLPAKAPTASPESKPTTPSPAPVALPVSDGPVSEVLLKTRNRFFLGQ